MVLIIVLVFLFGWNRLPLFSHFDDAEMIRFSMIKFFYYAGYLPVHQFAPFMVISTTHVENRDLCMKVSTRLEDAARDIFIQHQWLCDLVLHHHR
jgi:hypothetical protein